MPTRDPAKSIKDALVARWATEILPTDPPGPDLHYHPTWAATLHVDDDWRPVTPPDTGIEAALLVANDGGPAIHAGPWVLHAPLKNKPTKSRGDIRHPLIRLTAFAAGRTTNPDTDIVGARNVVEDAVDWLLDNHVDGIARIDGVSDILITRDPDTGNFLASVTMPVIARPAPVPA